MKVKKGKLLKINLSNPDIDTFSPTKNLLDENFLARVVLECLKNNDHEGAIEVFKKLLEDLEDMQLGEMAEVALKEDLDTLKK